MLRTPNNLTLTNVNFLNKIVNSVFNKTSKNNLSFNKESNNYIPNYIRNIYSFYPFFQQGYATKRYNGSTYGIPLCGPDVTNMYSAYEFCTNLVGDPICGINVNNMALAYRDCHRITGSPVCGNKIDNMAFAYQNCYNLTGSPVCGNNVVNMSYAYNNCWNLTGAPVCGDNVVDISDAYSNCWNLTGSPACGDNVVNMRSAYSNCLNLTGSPVCGNNVVYMRLAYQSCYNLTGSPVCGNKVNTMEAAYCNCYNLTGQPICGQNVDHFSSAYYNCHNLTGQPLIKNNNIFNAEYAFSRCYNINGTVDFGAGKFNPTGNYIGIFEDCVHLGGFIVYGTNSQITRARWNNAFNRVGAPVGLPYNQENTYNVGDLIWHNNNGYSCIKAINIPEQLDLNKWELNNNVVNGYWRLNIITNIQTVAANLRLETGCTMTAIANVNEIVEVPYALPNGQIYGNRKFHCVRNCYNEFYNIYIYVADREEV